MRLDEVGDLMLVNRIRRFVRCCDGWVFFSFLIVTIGYGT